MSEAEAAAFAEAGVEVLAHTNLGLTDGYPEIPSARVLALVGRLPQGAVDSAEAIVLSCTGWHTLSVVTELERRYGKPVLSSNLAMALLATRIPIGCRCVKIERVKATPLDVRRVHRLIERAASLPDVRAEVEANHDENRWWPTTISDPRMRMLAAGWSTRVSYRMIETYARVIASADVYGFDSLVAATDAELATLVRALGRPRARIDYLRSLAELLGCWEKEGTDPTAESADCDALVFDFAARVRGASYKVAQCALLTARGYHCGIIPVDSGMVTKLARPGSRPSARRCGSRTYAARPRGGRARSLGRIPVTDDQQRVRGHAPYGGTANLVRTPRPDLFQTPVPQRSSPTPL